MAILLLSGDMMFVPQLTAVGTGLGQPVQWAISAATLVEKAAEAPNALVVIDLSMTGLEMQTLVSELRALAEPPKAILAFGPHVQKDRLAAAEASGCDQVLTRGQFNAHMQKILGAYFV